MKLRGVPYLLYWGLFLFLFIFLYTFYFFPSPMVVNCKYSAFSVKLEVRVFSFGKAVFRVLGT